MNDANTINREDIVSTNYKEEDIPGPVKQYRPVVYRDGDEYCCLLGPNPQDGIFGSGNDVQEAMADWVKHYDDYMQDADEEDVQLLQSWTNIDS